MKNPIKQMGLMSAAALFIAIGMNCAGSSQQQSTASAESGKAAATGSSEGSNSPSAPAAVAKTAAGEDELDIAIRDASDYLNDNIPKESKIVILNIESNSANLSEYIIDELIANAVNDKNFSVVDRRQLEAIQSEQKFQMSGAVDDKDALAIGKFFGAQTIISGAMREIGTRYRLTIRALSVQTAQVQGQYNRNMSISETLTDLANSGGSRPASGAATTSPKATQAATAPATAQTAVALPAGGIAVSSVSNWNTAINTIRNGGNNQTYLIDVSGNISVPVPPNNENLFGSLIGIMVTLQGNGTISPSSKDNLLRIGTGQMVVVRGSLTLRGRSDNDINRRNSVVVVESGGQFRMEGNASITGNTTGSPGGGVYVNGGDFTMQGGTISGNTARVGGGVFVASGGTFTMEGGTISGNTTSYNEGGGGVALGGSGLAAPQSKGTFVMKGGTISGNTVNKGNGGGVSVNWFNSIFTMEGGTISGNVTSGEGGGVYIHGFVKNGFTKTGGTISGNDAAFGNRNTAKQGHAVWNSEGNRWRNATAGPDDGTEGYGFWLND
jgi:TolB-like protein